MTLVHIGFRYRRLLSREGAIGALERYRTRFVRRCCWLPVINICLPLTLFGDSQSLLRSQKIRIYKSQYGSLFLISESEVKTLLVLKVFSNDLVCLLNDLTLLFILALIIHALMNLTYFLFELIIIYDLGKGGCSPFDSGSVWIVVLHPAHHHFQQRIETAETKILLILDHIKDFHLNSCIIRSTEISNEPAVYVQFTCVDPVGKMADIVARDNMIFVKDKIIHLNAQFLMASYGYATKNNYEFFNLDHLSHVSLGETRLQKISEFVNLVRLLIQQLEDLITRLRILVWVHASKYDDIVIFVVGHRINHTQCWPKRASFVRQV